MRMTASAAADRLRRFDRCVYPHGVWWSQLAASGQKVRHGAAAKGRILPPQLGFEKSVASEKENRVSHFRPLTGPLFEPMFRNQEVVGILETDYLDAHELVFHDDRVHSVWEEVLNAMQPRQWTTI